MFILDIYLVPSREKAEYMVLVVVSAATSELSSMMAKSKLITTIEMTPMYRIYVWLLLSSLLSSRKRFYLEIGRSSSKVA